MFMGLGMPIPDLSNKPGPGRPGWSAGSYDFQFEVAGSLPVTIKAQPAATGTFTIKWPNGTEQTTNGSDSITAPDATEGIVSINKKTDTTYADEFAVVGNKTAVTKVISWGNNNWSNMASAFKDCTNLTELPSASNIFKAGSASLSQFISECTSLTELDMTGWDLGSGTGTNLYYLAWNCTNLQKVVFKNKDVKLSTSTPRLFEGVGTNVSVGCEFDMEGLNFTGTCNDMNTWFITARAKVGSNFSNWRFNQSVTNLSLVSLFNQLKFVDTSAVLNISGWTDCNAINLSGMFQGAGGASSAAPIDAINITGLRTNDTTTMYRMFKSTKISRIIGLNDLVSNSLTGTGAVEMFNSSDRLILKDPSVTPTENLSNSFGSNWSITSVANMFDRLNEKGNTYSEYSYPPNLTGFNLSNVTNYAGFAIYNDLSAPYDLSSVTFPTSAISLQGSFSSQVFTPTSDFTFDFTNVTINVSNFQQTFQNNQCNRYKFGSNVNFSNNTTFDQTFRYAGMPPILNNGDPSYRQIRVEFPTNANFGSVTTMSGMFFGQYGGYSNQVPFTNCQADNFIRIIYGTAFSNNLTVDLLNSQVTEAPSVVQSKLQELTTGAGGWSITVNSTDATMPFVYTGSFLTGTDITPTINTSEAGAFSSSDVTVNATTGTFNTSTAGNVTIRYTITATGCYNEQVLSVVPPFSPFKFRVTGPISIKAQPAVAGQNFTIDWGDGSTPVSTPGGTSIASPSYPAGTYDVQINAQGDNTYCDDFAIVSGQTNVTQVLDWGENPWSNMYLAFDGCTSLSDISTTSFISSSNQAIANKSMIKMFNGCTSLLEADIRNWDLTPGVDWNGGSPFNGLVNLQRLDMTGMSIKILTRGTGAFASVGTAVTNGCEFLMSGIDWSTSTGTILQDFFANAKINPNSDLSNWVFPSSTVSLSRFFRGGSLAGVNSTLNMSGWSTLSTTSFFQFFQNFNSADSPDTDQGMRINISNINVSGADGFNSMFEGCDVTEIIGLSTLGASSATNANLNKFADNARFLKFSSSDNFSNAFIASLNPSNVSEAFQWCGSGVSSNFGAAPNLTNINLSNVTSLSSTFEGARFYDAPDLSTATFPSTGVEFFKTFKTMRTENSNTHVDFSNVSVKISNAREMFNSAYVDNVTFGNNVDFSSCTDVYRKFNNSSLKSGTINITYPTAESGLSWAALTQPSQWFASTTGPTTGPLTICQVDNLIRSFHNTALNSGLTVDFGLSKITESPSVVSTLVTELENTGGWNITPNTLDGTIPFQYGTGLEPDTTITPTNNTGSAFTGTFTSSNSNIAVNSTTGVINTPNGGNTTIRYTLANGCYTEQAIVINFPFKIEVVIPSDDLVFPIYGSSSTDADYDFTVDWGDGTSNSYSGAAAGRSISRTYLSAGTYQISIKGNAWPGAIWSAGQNKLNRITKLLSWGNTGIRDLSYAFSGSTALVQATPPDVIKFSANGTGQMRNCFQNCVNLTTASIAGTDTSAITNVSGIFAREVFSGCTSLETLDVQNITIGDNPGLYTVVTAIYRFAAYVGTNVTDGTEINFSNITFANSVPANEYGTHQFFYSARIKSSIADNWNFTGHSGNINLESVLYSAVFPTTNKTAYFRNWTFNSNNNIDISSFGELGQFDEIDFSGNTEIMYINRSYQTIYNSQVQRIKGLDKWKSATTIKSSGLQRIFRNATFMTFSTTDSQYNFRNDFIHSGSNADSIYLGFASCGSNAAVASIDSVPNMGTWGMDNITSLNQAFSNTKFSNYPTLYWNLSNVSSFYFAFYQGHPKGTNYTKDIDFRNCTFAPSTSTINVDMSRAFYRAYFQNIYFSSSEELPRNNVLSRTFSGLNDTSLESTNLDKWNYGNIGSASEDLYLLQGYGGTLSATYYADILARIRATAPTSVNSYMTYGNSRLNASAIYTTQQGPSSGWNVVGTTVIEETGIGENVSVGDIFYQSNQSQSSRYYYRITAVSADEITIASGLVYTGNYWNILTSQAAKDRQYIVENLAISFTDGIPIL